MALAGPNSSSTGGLITKLINEGDSNNGEDVQESEYEGEELGEETEDVSQTLGEQDSDCTPSVRQNANEGNSRRTIRPSITQEEGEKSKAKQPQIKQWASLFVGRRQRSEGPTLRKIDVGEGLVKFREEDIQEATGRWEHSVVGYFGGRFPGKKALNVIVESWKVELPNLPLSFWGNESLSRICSKVGNPINVDKFTATFERFSYARALVEIDMAKEVVEYVEVELPNGKKTLSIYLYENLPKYCTNCAIMGHSVGSSKVLESIQEKKAMETKKNKPWGRQLKRAKKLIKESTVLEATQKIEVQADVSELGRSRIEDVQGRVQGSDEIKRQSMLGIMKKKFRSWQTTDNFQQDPNGRIMILWQENRVSLEVKESSAQVSSLFVRYYMNLLGTRKDCQSLESEFLMEGSWVSDTQGMDLIRPVADEEIKAALYGIGDDKAPGPDGYSAYFFKKSWSIIGEDVCLAIKEFFMSGNILNQINHAIIALVPKSANTTRVEDFRPISCCNVVYKIISKILASRLSPILESLIDPAQSTFVPNRSMVENIYMVQVLLQKYTWNRISPRCIMKVDLRKAYDTVNWEFLENALLGFKFPPMFVKWIMQCVVTTSYSLSINGTLHGFFKGKQGLRQGDPLSPFLFAICLEVLSRKLGRLKRIPEFKHHPKCLELSITHLAFADDLILFTRGDAISVKLIMECLKQFGNYSGLYVNASKSCVFMTGILGVRDRITSLCKNFLWGGKATGSKRPLVAWKDICKPKLEGGLGFMDLNAWNWALLAKALWNLQSKKDTLQVWMEIKAWLGFTRALTTLKAAIKWISKEGRGTGVQAIAKRIGIACVVYYLWKHRNTRMFEGQVAGSYCGCWVYTFVELRVSSVAFV
ncbi:hypothetical protein Acr_00g0090060 [Actinidia rufa]|uniref:Reverse transcriptase domain-containing protein n=1 Tax=Actinidia rufa TaxID=165716 RepID=A0A7J0DWY2_9ERIC|nr:hypothetical protein Acr_00g0090060 [Actinidia rufa]